MALDVFKALLRNRMAPSPRSWICGIRSGVPDEIRVSSCASFFQRSRLAPPAEVRFTANLTIFGRDSWGSARRRDPDLPEQPGPSIFYPTVDGIQTRIGHLAGGSTDIWWKIGGQSDVESVATEVVGAIRSFMIPVIHWSRTRPR